ncbi:MAG: hypothetical protein GY861_13290 [bacterium]|nr:hypothetical protein [bacterium]
MLIKYRDEIMREIHKCHGERWLNSTLAKMDMERRIHTGHFQQSHHWVHKHKLVDYQAFRHNVFTNLFFQHTNIQHCLFYKCVFDHVLLKQSVVDSCRFVKCTFNMSFTDHSVVANCLMDKGCNGSMNFLRSSAAYNYGWPTPEGMGRFENCVVVGSQFKENNPHCYVEDDIIYRREYPFFSDPLWDPANIYEGPYLMPNKQVLT